MRVAIIGRSQLLLKAAEQILAAGHEIPIVWTCRSEAYYEVGVEEFKAFAKKAGAEFREDIKINAPESVAFIKSLRCELGVSVNWLTVIGAELINSFPEGVLNAHAGDLPRYRGNACPNWAIINGEPHVGLTIHRMVPDLDAGPIVLKELFPLGADTYIGSVYEWMNERIPAMLSKSVELIAAGKVSAKPQPEDPALALRCYPRRPEDGKIDWRLPAEETHRMIRASSRPFAGAFTTLEGREKVIIWRAQLVKHAGPFFAVPGQVCYRVDGDPVIACAGGPGAYLLRLTDVEVPEKELTGEKARAFLASSMRNRLV